jgi:purine-binding chemotaxis protein CheW
MDTVPALRDRIAAGDPLQVVALSLSAGRYAVDVLAVEEVVHDVPIHPLPDAPPALVGVLSLRGQFLPVIDLGPALGVGAGRRRASSVVVVSVGASRVGVLAEEVSEVILLEPGSVRGYGGREAERDPRFLGVARYRDELLTLIDPVELMAETTGIQREEIP